MSKKIKLFLIFFTVSGLIPIFSFAATMSISPASGEFEVGERKTFTAVISSKESINAVSGTISFPSIFTIESISKSSSILNFWVSEPTFSQTSGVIQFEGVALGGFSDGSGTVLSITVKAAKEGTGSVVINSGQILANDGQGTNITSSFGDSNFTIKPRSVPAPTTKEKDIIKHPQIIAPEVKEETPEPPTLKSPEIMLGNKFGEEAIVGNSDYINNQVLITFLSQEGTKIFVQDKTDTAGNFITLVPQTLKRGVYEISAVIIKEDLSYTNKSNTIKLKIGSIFSDISNELKVIILLIITLAVILTFKIIIFIIRRNMVKKRVLKESDEALEMVKKSFKNIKDDLYASPNSKEIQEQIEDAEKTISKEIKDIPEKL